MAEPLRPCSARGKAPRRKRKATASALRVPTAVPRGVVPRDAIAFTSAPASRSKLATDSSHHVPAALCSGVRPFSSATSGRAPASSRDLTVPASFASTA